MGDDDIRQRLEKLPRSTLAALLRIGRRIDEGFEGEITMSVQRKGINFLRWTQHESGNVIREELG